MPVNKSSNELSNEFSLKKEKEKKTEIPFFYGKVQIREKHTY